MPKADIASLNEIVPELIERANLVLAQDEKLITEVEVCTEKSYLTQSRKIWSKFLKQLELLETDQFELPDGKSIGTFIEKLLTVLFSIRKGCIFTGSAAKGIDLPELNLGIKATSDRQPQSSEPFRNAYERIFGIENALLVFIYNGTAYATGAETNLRCIQHYLLSETNVADKGLCSSAREARDLFNKKIISEDILRRILRLLVLSDKSNREFLNMCRLIREMAAILQGKIKGVEFRFLTVKNNDPDLLTYINSAKTHEMLSGAIDAYEKQFASFPFASEGLATTQQMKRFQEHPLDGKISLSFALQWRLQFPLFSTENVEEA